MWASTPPAFHKGDIATAANTVGYRNETRTGNQATIVAQRALYPHHGHQLRSDRRTLTTAAFHDPPSRLEDN
jgi:hypothetical protein